MTVATMVVMNVDTGKPWVEGDDLARWVSVPTHEVAEWQRSWIGKQSLLAQMPLRECPPREAGQR